MATLDSIISDIATLSEDDKLMIRDILIQLFSVNNSSLEKFVTENRFSRGLVCPICGGHHVMRNGHRKDGVQRYLCGDCGKSFVATTNTITAGTKLGLKTWEKYIDCMMNGFSVRKSALYCGISKNTAFTWRHKILGALQKMAGSVILNGIIEADETFFPVSYKGNHKNSQSFTMPRKAHKRGKSVHKRGLSQEQLCVPCAVNRNGLSIAKASNLGKISTKSLHKVYDGKIDKDSTMVTDLMNSYRRFTNKNGIQLIQLKGGKSKKGIYNIQHINSYHNELKRFLYGFRGVSSKHLDNYLIWHNFVNYAPESEIDKRSIFLRFVLTQDMTIHVNEISRKPVLPFVA